MRGREPEVKQTVSRGLTFVLVSVLACSPAFAFEVVRNVNSPTPPADKVILFEKGKGIDHLVFDKRGTCEAALADDGQLRVHLAGTGECLLNIGWKAGDGRPEGFSLASYSALKIVCRVEGSAKVTGRGRNAKVAERGVSETGGIQLGLKDAAGLRLWGDSLSTFAADGKNPKETTAILAYFNLFIVPPDGKPSDVRGIQFRMPPRGREDRDYHIVIERISLVEKEHADVP